MAAREPYREGGAAEGLPFPRKRIDAWVALTVASMAIVWLLPLVLLVASRQRAFTELATGGRMMAFLVPLAWLAPLSACVLAAPAIRGRRRIAPWMLTAPVIVSVVMSFITWRASHLGAVRYLLRANDPIAELHEGFSAFSDEEIPLAVGALTCAATLFVAAVGATGIVASIDRVSIGKKAGIGGLVALVVAIAGGVAGLAYALSIGAPSYQPTMFVVSSLASCAFAALASVCAAAARSVQGWHDRAEASNVAGAIVVVALACALATFLLDRASISLFTHEAFRVLGSVGAAPPERTARAIEWGAAVPAYRTLSLVHVGSVLASFVPAFVTARSALWKPVSGSALFAVGLAFVASTAFVDADAHAVAFLRSLAARTDAGPIAVTLPRADGAQHVEAATGMPIVVPRGLTRPIVVRPAQSDTKTLTIAADKAVTMHDLREFVDDPESSYFPKYTTMELAIDPRSLGVAPLDPDVAAVLGPSRPVLSTVMVWTAPADPARPRVEIAADGKLWVTPAYEGSTAMLSMSDDLGPALTNAGKLHGYTVAVWIYARPDTTVDTLVRLVAAIRSADWHGVNVTLAAP